MPRPLAPALIGVEPMPCKPVAYPGGSRCGTFVRGSQPARFRLQRLRLYTQRLRLHPDSAPLAIGRDDILPSTTHRHRHFLLLWSSLRQASIALLAAAEVLAVAHRNGPATRLPKDEGHRGGLALALARLFHRPVLDGADRAVFLLSAIDSRRFPLNRRVCARRQVPFPPFCSHEFILAHPGSLRPVRVGRLRLL